MGKSIFAKTQKSIDNFGSACYNNTVDVPSTYSSLAQSVERVTVNHDVVGSSPTGGAKEKTIRTGWSFSLLLVSLRSKEFAGFASRNRRRSAAEGKLIGGCCADAVESQQGEPGKSTCFRKCFFSYIRLAASDIAFGSDIRFASGIVLRTVWRANIISLRGSAISLLRRQKYRAAHRAAYHIFLCKQECW